MPIESAEEREIERETVRDKERERERVSGTPRDQRPETRDQRPETRDQRPETRDQQIAVERPSTTDTHKPDKNKYQPSWSWKE